MKKFISLLLTAAMAMSLAACGEAATTTSGTSAEGTKTTDAAANVETTVSEGTKYAVGEAWTVDGQWTLMILGAAETDERSEYSDETPEAVYIVDYVYTNGGYESEYADGLCMYIEDTVVDSAGKAGYSYPGSITNIPREAPVGATCRAQACIGVDNAGTFTLTVAAYDGNDNIQSADFLVDPAAEYADYTPQSAAAVSAADYDMGDTWTVDGQWELTINGVHTTDERNEYSYYNPAAVYIVNYTYTNLGYENDYSDGLYMGIDDTIVDAEGWMGYSYPGSITNYSQMAPVGATCDAEACIGVDHAGTFTLYVTVYDGQGEKQTASFLVAAE